VDPGRAEVENRLDPAGLIDVIHPAVEPAVINVSFPLDGFDGHNIAVSVRRRGLDKPMPRRGGENVEFIGPVLDEKSRPIAG